MDIAVAWDTANFRGDWVIVRGGLGVNTGIHSAVVLSLFTDRRASPDFVPNDGTADRRGWWGDTLEPSLLGSRLWQLNRAKKTDNHTLLLQARDFCREALQWLIDLGVVAEINVQTNWLTPQVIGISVEVVKPGAGPVTLRYAWAWDQLPASVQPPSYSPAPIPAPPTPVGVNYVGVNLAGLEFNAGVLPGVGGTDYPIPTTSEIDYYKGKGCNVIRLPMLMERAQPTINGALNATYLGYMDTLISYATGRGVSVVIDAHNYGSAWGGAIGVSGGTSNSAFANFWAAIASRYGSNSSVIFGLMNEPGASGQTSATWLASSNAATAGIRGAGATSQLILAQGAIGDGAAAFVKTGNDAAFASGVVDPNNNSAIEVHQYFDPDGSGTAAVDPANGYVPPELLTSVTLWARANRLRLWLGEYGGDNGTGGVAAITNAQQYMQNNKDVWFGCTAWAGGPGWSPSYVNLLEPAGGVDKPQMVALATFAPGGSQVGTAVALKKYPIAFTSPTFGAGKFGNCLTGGYAGGLGPDFGNLYPPVPSLGFTIEAWMRCDAANGSDQVIAHIANFFQIGVYNDGTALVKYGNSDAIILNSSTSLVGVGFHHVELNLTPTGGLLFVDGALVASSPTTLVTTGWTPGSQLGIKATWNGFAPLTGAVDEVTMWGVVRHTANFTPPTAPYAGTELGLFGVYHLENASDTFGFG